MEEPARRPRHMQPLGIRQNQTKRISSLTNLGVLVEQVIMHTAKNSGRNGNGSRQVLFDNGQQRASLHTNETLIKLATPRSNSNMNSPSAASRNNIRFNDGSTSLLFSAKNQQLIKDDQGNVLPGGIPIISSPTPFDVNSNNKMRSP